MNNTLDVVVGGLYGSEAKGHAVQRLVERRKAQGHSVFNVRVGGPNAGHTGYDREGRAWALRQVPIGVVHDGPVVLGIAPGSEIDLPVLLEEIDALTDAGLLNGSTGTRLIASSEATMIEDHHKETEARAIEGRVGTTAKGIGAARAERLLRKAKRLADDPDAIEALVSRGVAVTNGQPSRSATIVEGTQGYALGTHAGFYPQCTSGNCRAIDFLSQAGISPWDPAYGRLTVWVVARVFPIRIAGNSGPLRNETSWDALGLDPEFTTVTKKQRRVGKPDWDLLREAIVANGGGQDGTVQVALSMVDQAFPEVAGVPWSEDAQEWAKASEFLYKVEAEIDAPIGLVMSGPNTAAFRGIGENQ